MSSKGLPTIPAIPPAHEPASAIFQAGGGPGPVQVVSDYVQGFSVEGNVGVGNQSPGSYGLEGQGKEDKLRWCYLGTVIAAVISIHPYWSSGRACLQRPRRHLSETHIWPPVGLSGEASGSGKLPNTGPGSVRERRVASSRLRSIAAAASKMH